MSRIYVVFDDSTEFYWARTRVLEKLATVGKELPRDVIPALGPDATSLGQIFWYTVDGANLGLDELRTIQDFQVKYALQAVDGLLAKQPGSTDLLKKKFHILAVGLKDREAALACGDELFKQTRKHATLLNNFAWALLTEDQYGGQYSELALRYSARSNELTEHKNWMFVDTLARAKFHTGDIEEAIELQKKAIELSNGAGLDDMNKALARMEKALEGIKTATNTG